MELNALQADVYNTIWSRIRALHEEALSQYQYDFASIGSKFTLVQILKET